MKKIIFQVSREYGTTVTETFEFSDDATDEEIQEEFKNWVFEITGNRFGWWEE